MAKSKVRTDVEPGETGAKPSNGKKGTQCPISRQQFKKAKGIVVTVEGQSINADPKEFSTGSLGWYTNGKVTIEVDGVPCKAQVGMNITIVGSKELPGGVASR